MDQSLVVAAIDAQGDLAYYSNYGGPTAIAAPESAILSTMPYDEYSLMSGTSMAAPMVTCVAALESSQHPEFTTTKLKNVLIIPENTTQLQNFNGGVSSMGMVNAWKAVTGESSTVRGRSSNAMAIDRNPFSGQDVKSVVNEIMNTTDDSEKTGNLIVKVVPDIDIDALIALVEEETGIAFELDGEIVTPIAYEIQVGSVENADTLVKLFNAYDEVQFAEPNDMRR